MKNIDYGSVSNIQQLNNDIEKQLWKRVKNKENTKKHKKTNPKNKR